MPFECTHGEIDSGGKPAVRTSSSSLPAADLTLVLSQPGCQLRLGQAETAAYRPEAIWQVLACRLRVVAEEADDAAVVLRKRFGPSVLPEGDGLQPHAELLGDGSLPQAAVEATLP